MRPANVPNRSSPPTPMSERTRRATDSVDVDTATHTPSAQRYVPRGTVYGMPEPSRGWSSPRCAQTLGSAPMHWSIDSSRFTSITWPSPVRSRWRKRDHHGERPDHGGDLVGERDRRQERAPVGLAVDGGEPAHRLGQGREPGTAGVGAVLPEAGHAQDDEPGVAADEVVRREAEPLERAGAEVLDEHVGAVDEAAHVRQAVVGLEVEHDAALAPADELPPQPFPVARVAPAQVAQAVTVR